jgi:DNA-binding GntR family transcriptional regulator
MSKLTAYQILKERLLSGELAPGQFVTQKELAALAGVPLAAAREAIQKLEHETLMKVHPQRGIQVTEITNKLIRDAFALRLVLEREAVRAFADVRHRSTAEDLLDETRAVLAEAGATLSADVLERAVDVDWHMHDVIIDSLGNDLIRDTYQINAVRVRLIRASNRLPPDRLFSALNEHAEILECCLVQDAAGAAHAMERHIATALDRALRGM